MRLTNLVSLIVILMFFIYFLYMLFFTPIMCEEYKEVKFRYIGIGGLVGGKEKVEVNGNIYDGYMKKCVRGNNIIGKEMLNEVSESENNN